MQKVGFNCTENASMLKIKLQTAHSAFQALLFLTVIRVSAVSECRKCVFGIKIDFFPEKLLLKKNFCLGLLKKPFLKLWGSLWRSVLH